MAKKPGLSKEERSKHHVLCRYENVSRPKRSDSGGRDHHVVLTPFLRKCIDVLTNWIPELGVEVDTFGIIPTKETNVAHVPHHPENSLKLHPNYIDIREHEKWQMWCWRHQYSSPLSKRTTHKKERLRHYLIFMTDAGSIQREIRRRITIEAKMASQKCGDEL